jgi:hypothetical protein
MAFSEFHFLLWEEVVDLHFTASALCLSHCSIKKVNGFLGNFSEQSRVFSTVGI